MRARGTDLREVLFGKDGGKGRPAPATGANFASALKQSLASRGAAKLDDVDRSSPSITMAGPPPQARPGQLAEPSAELEKAVPGRARERRSHDRARDGAEPDASHVTLALPFDRLQVRGLGMDAGGASVRGREGATAGDGETSRGPSPRVASGHVLGLTITPERARRDPSMADPAGPRAATENAAPALTPPGTEIVEVSRRFEAQMTRPPLPTVEPAMVERRAPEPPSTRSDVDSPASSPVAMETRHTSGPAAVLERSVAVATAREELGQQVSVRPTPRTPTVDALPAGLGGELSTNGRQESTGGRGAREGSADRDGNEREERVSSPEPTRTGGTDGFAVPTHEGGATESVGRAAAGTPEPRAPDGATGPERIAEVVEHLEIRGVEAGRNPTPLKVNLGELGEVRVSMTREDGLSVRLDASDPRAAAALESGRRELEVALEAHGLRELRVATDGSAVRVAAERLPTERSPVEGPRLDGHGRADDRDGAAGQDRSGRNGSEGRESGAQQERDHREAMNAAFERRERERRFSPQLGQVPTGRPLGSA